MILWILGELFVDYVLTLLDFCKKIQKLSLFDNYLQKLNLLPYWKFSIFLTSAYGKRSDGLLNWFNELNELRNIIFLFLNLNFTIIDKYLTTSKIEKEIYSVGHELMV